MSRLVMALVTFALQDGAGETGGPGGGWLPALDRLALYQEPLIGAEQDTDRLEQWLGMLADLFEQREPMERLFAAARDLEDLVDVWMGMAGAREFDRWTEGGTGLDRAQLGRLLACVDAELLRAPLEPGEYPLSFRWSADLRRWAGDPGLPLWSGPANVGYFLYGALSRPAAWPADDPGLRETCIGALLMRAKEADDEAVSRVVLHALRPSLDADLILTEGARKVPTRAPLPDGHPGPRRPLGFTEAHRDLVEEWLQDLAASRVQDASVALTAETVGPGLRCALILRRRMRAELRPDGDQDLLHAPDLAGPFPLAVEAWTQLLQALGPRRFRERAWPAVRDMLAGDWPVPGLDQALAELESLSGSGDPGEDQGRTAQVEDLRLRRRQVQEQLAAELARLHCEATPSVAEGWEGMLALVDGQLAGMAAGPDHPALLPAWVTLVGRDPGLAMDLLRRHADGPARDLPTRAVEAILAQLSASGHASPADQAVVERLARRGSPRERWAALSAADVLSSTVARDLFRSTLEDLRQEEEQGATALLFEGACRLLVHSRGWPGRAADLSRLASLARHHPGLGRVEDPALRRQLAPLLEPGDRAAFLSHGRLPSSASGAVDRR